tara:strand:+ start:419 stop:1423 length:1005 start_codon:yes stop_codon:yes gene_type:complete
VKILDIGESKLIEIIQDLVSAPERDSNFINNRLLVGIGDDASAWQPGPGLEISTTDTLVQGVHFSLSYSSWYDIGWKAMASNLSDISAMGGVPLYALINAGFPSYMDVDDVKDLYKGMLSIADKYSVRIMGGDLVRCETSFITVMIIGTSERDLLLRSNMTPGDLIAVTGNLGSSAAGLRILSGDLSCTNEAHESIIESHLRPCPRINEGLTLAANGIRAAMDISDGLIIDLNKFCDSSGVGAVVYADKIPISQYLQEIFSSDEIIALALGGGEDYELLFSGPRDIVLSIIPKLASGATIIGKVSESHVGKVHVLDSENRKIALDDIGWDHFKL